MSKKGVSARTVAPTWLSALINPDILERHLSLLIKEHALQKERLLTLAQAATQEGSQKAAQHHDLFSLKQLGGPYHCDITRDNFTKGHEKEWIQFIKSLENEDSDPDHANQEHIRREIQNTKLFQAKNVIDQLSKEDTQDQQAHEKREINQKKFPEYLLSSLEKSPSQSLIIQLVNSKGEKEPLALVQLKGQNGLWLHDPKLGCTMDFNHTNITGFKQFLMEHIKVNHPEFNQAFIIQLGNKQKLKLSQKEVPKNAKELFFQDKKTQKSQLTESQSEQESKEEPKKPTKPRV